MKPHLIDEPAKKKPAKHKNKTRSGSAICDKVLLANGRTVVTDNTSGSDSVSIEHTADTSVLEKQKCQQNIASAQCVTDCQDTSDTEDCVSALFCSENG